MSFDDHVLECGFEQYLNTDKPAEYMARESITLMQKAGVRRRLCHLMAEADAPLPGLRERWEVSSSGNLVGQASSCAWSPKYNANLMFAMLDIEVSEPGTRLTVNVAGTSVDAVVRNDRWK